MLMFFSEVTWVVYCRARPGVESCSNVVLQAILSLPAAPAVHSLWAGPSQRPSLREPSALWSRF